MSDGATNGAATGNLRREEELRKAAVEESNTGLKSELVISRGEYEAVTPQR